MKLFGRIIIVLLVIAILLLLGYLVYRFILPLWAPLLFYVYLLLGSIILGFGWIMLLRDLAKSKDPRETLLASIRKAAAVSKRASPLKNFRLVVSILAGVFEGAIVWPTDVVRGMLESKRRQIFGAKQLILKNAMTLTEHLHALFPLIIISAAIGLGILGLNGRGYGCAFVYIMGLSLSLRHLRYSFEIDGLPTRLRRTSTHPYGIFLFLIIADFTSLLLVFTLASSGHAPSQIGISDFSAAAVSLFQFRQLIKLFTGQTLHLQQVLSGCAGLLFYLAYLRIIMRFQDFKQQDADRYWLASHNNMLGNFSTSLRLLERIESPTNEIRVHKIVAFLGVNQIPQAKQEARLFLEQKNESPENDRKFRVLMDFSVLAPIPSNAIIALFSDGLRSRVSDVIMQDILFLYTSMRPEIIGDVADIFLSVSGDYPLTNAVIKLQNDQIDQACSLLEAATPGTEIEEITRMALHLRATLLNPETDDDEDTANLKQWLQDELPTMVELLQELSEPLELTVGFAQIMLVRLFVRILAKDWEEQLIYHGDQLKKKVSGHPEGELLVRALEMRFEKLT